jgi:hypothetical protein
LLGKKRRIKMRGAKFFGIGVISTACVLVLLLAVGMGMFPGKAQAAWERYSAFVTFNEFPGGEAINGSKIRDDDMDPMDPGERFTSGYSDGTYPYDGEFEVTAWIRNPPPGQKLVSNSFRVFISNMTACEQYPAGSHRTVVLDFSSVMSPSEDNVYVEVVQYWEVRQVHFAVNNKLPSILKMEPGDMLFGTDGYSGTTESDLKFWFNFVVPGLTLEFLESIGVTRELKLDGHDCGLIVFSLRFDFKISAEYNETAPSNPVDTTLANKWTVTNTSPVTLEITEKVPGPVKKGKAKEEWQKVSLAQYNMPLQLTMVLASGGSPAPKRYNTLSTLWGKIKAR